MKKLMKKQIEHTIGYILEDHDPEGWGWFSGWNHKYADMFNRTWMKDCAKVFESKEEAERVRKILNEKYHWDFVLVPVIRNSAIEK